MAKARSTKSGRGAKGKSTRGRKKAAPAHELPGGFWRQIVAILLALVAVFLVLTWMGDGGDLLNSVDGFLNSAIGNAKYLVPVLLIWMAWKIFRTENNRLAPVVWIASILMIFWAAGAFGLSSVGQENPNGGVVGEWLNQFMVQILNPSAAIIIYIILIFVTAAFILQMNPVQMVQKVGDLFRTTEKEEAPAKREKVEKQVAVKGARKAAGAGATGASGADVEIQVNEGVEEEAPKLKPQPKFSMFAKLGRKKDKGAEEVAEPVEMATEAAGAAVAVGNSERALVAMTDVNWKLPPVSLLEKKQAAADSGDVQQTAKIIKNTLSEFGIDVEMEGANVGPRVTQYTMRPPSGVNLSKILARDKELALNLAVDKVRIEAPIPGTRSVGVELPNAKSADVRLRGVIESPEWKKATDPLTFAVGKDISGKAVVANLAKMPHLLIAGTTGSGKSVMTNSLISSLLYRNSPSDMKLIIVDPKQVEMAQYEDIPHLLTPIITSVEKALSALKWAVNEMEKRYTIMAEEKVKNIVDYNAKMAKRAEEAAASAASVKGVGKSKAATVDSAAGKGSAEGKADEKTEKTAGAEVVDDAKTVEQQGERMPYIVILIDEMADLMMMAGKDLEMPIVRIAQKGRAAGIHLVLATQRPEVKVITGLIKANIPGRIAFAVGSQIDSRVMLDMTGAEKLLGKGDMLMLTTEMMGKPRRIQGAWASDEDVAKLTDFLRAQRGPDYNADVVAQPVQIKGMGPADGGAIGDLGRRYDPNDPVVRKAIEITLRQGKFSTASLQTWLGKGHGFVSGLAIWLEEIGVIGPAQGHKPRDVLISTMEEFDKLANGE